MSINPVLQALEQTKDDSLGRSLESRLWKLRKFEELAQRLPQQHKAEPGQKFDAGKPRHDLFYEPFLAEVHAVLVFGERKYGAWNFSRGMSYSRLFNAAMRHLKAWWWDREDLDPETGLHHLAHCAANLMMAYCLARLGRGTDDRPTRESITGEPR